MRGLGIGQEDLGTRRIGDKGKDLFQVLTPCPLVPLSPLLPYLFKPKAFHKAAVNPIFVTPQEFVRW